MMVGRDVQLVVDKAPCQPREPILVVDDLSVLDDRGAIAVESLSFEVRGGEILAVAGVQGNGQTEMVEAITGMRRALTGSIHLDGKDITSASPTELWEAEMGHIPEDRQADGLVGAFSVADNLVLNTCGWNPFARGIVRDHPEVCANARKLVEDFDVRTASIHTPAGTLSGGNQQKVIVAREFTHSSRMLVAAQPTRGLDVGSIQYIHGRIVAERDEGAAVLIVSSELDEVMALADRVAVMYEGRFVGILEGDEIDRNRIGLLMAGRTGEALGATTSGSEGSSPDTAEGSE
jgi:simple sugar transport system ATP-binding protein